MVDWPDHADEIIGGDLTAVLAYVTPAGGTVVSAVAPIGLRDRERGTVGFTTSLGFGKKLERIQRDPRVALAFTTRELGFSDRPGYVLVQGRAEPQLAPSPERRAQVEEQAIRFLGPLKRGRLFWDRWLRDYYETRVEVDIHVMRLGVWPDERCAGEPEWYGEPPPHEDPAPQRPPRQGTGPRVDPRRAAGRLAPLDHILLGYVDEDDFPIIAPAEVRGADARGIELAAPARLLPPGARRAGLVGHSFRPKLIGLRARGHTGWLEAADGAALYAPHTEANFRAPPNKTVMLLANGLLARQGVRRARREGKLAARG